MPRPPMLVCDADALFQGFLSDIKPLQILRAKYAIQPVIVPQVEIELKSNRKLAARISYDLKKALSSGLIRVLDVAALSLVGIQDPAAQAIYNAIQQLGNQYLVYSDYGEAFTHAAAITLGVPAMSHDVSALRALSYANLAV